MSLLSVTVKKARFVGPQASSQWNSYVTLKLQHVKSTTVQVKGINPSWEQDFLFEINNLDAGLLIEVWASGRMWDNSVGYHWLHLKDIQHAPWVINGTGQWLSLDAELVMRDGQVVGTKTPTGHALLIDARFELPYGTSEIEVDDAVDLQRKLEMYNSMLDEETRAEQARKQHQYYIQCESGVSEDSDYTSDVNYPVGQHPNSSASQFLSAANQLTTPQRSLTSSRENSYEKDDDYRTGLNPYQPPPYSGHRKQLPTVPPHPSNHHRNAHASQATTSGGERTNRNSNSYWGEEPSEVQAEADPLYYNSRPPPPQSNYRGGYSSGSSTFRRGDSWHDDGFGKGDRSSTRSQFGDGYDEAQEYSGSPSSSYAKRQKNGSRRGTPSLERQYTMYHGHDDHYGDYYQEGQESQKQSSRYQDSAYSATYQQQNLYNAQKSSVYDEYSDQEYGSAGTICNDYSRTSVDGSALNDGNYTNDTSYGEYGWSEDKTSLRDQYNRTPSSKRGKALPQLPIPPQSQSSQQVSPYASQSTVKEVSVSSMNVPSIIATQYEDPLPVSSASNAVAHPAVVPTKNDRSINSHKKDYYDPYATDISHVGHEESFYDAVSTTTSTTTTTTPFDNIASSTKIVSGAASSIFGGISKAITKVVDSAHQLEQSLEQEHQKHQQEEKLKQQQLAQNKQQQQNQNQAQTQDSQYDPYADPNQQYMDTYENQVGYEDWQNYGYYDEAGNYIQYDQSYYDDQATVTEEAVSSAAALDTTQIVDTTAESMLYTDQYDTYTSSLATTTTAAVTTTATATSTAASIAGNLQTTEVEVHTVQDDTYQYDNTEYYDAEGEMMQMDEYGNYSTEGVATAPEVYDEMGYTDDGYGYETGQTEYGYEPTTEVEPSQEQNKSDVEYNYAYQSVENLNASGYQNGYQSLDRSNSVSRRESFKRQISTRDYGYHDTMESSLSQQYLNTASARNSLTSQSHPSLPTTTAAATLPTASATAATGAAAVGAAASAATKLTSEIKSALPQIGGLGSLTKAKTGGLFSSGLGKMGSFLSSAAEKTGVPIPPIVKEGMDAAIAATAPKETKEKTEPQQQQQIPNHVKPSMPDDRQDYYDDQQMYDDGGWGQGPQQRGRHPYEPYDTFEGTDDGPESYATGPVHMDSLGSDVSEGVEELDASIEAQYRRNQKERIAKLNSMPTVDGEYYDYDNQYDTHKGVFQAADGQHIQNGDGRHFSKEDYVNQHSLDDDEWRQKLDEQRRPGLLKRGETEMSMGDSMEGAEYDDQFPEDDMRRPPKPIDGQGFQIEPMIKNDEPIRKSSLEMEPKEKGGKTVSFEEEPPKIERQITKGMTPREKWLWAINRICAQLAVSNLIL